MRDIKRSKNNLTENAFKRNELSKISNDISSIIENSVNKVTSDLNNIKTLNNQNRNDKPNKSPRNKLSYNSNYRTGNKHSPTNNIVTVDLSTPRAEELDPFKLIKKISSINFKNRQCPKVINLNVSNNSSTEKDKNFDRSKSEKILDIKNNIIKKYQQVPIVKTTLYESNGKENVNFSEKIQIKNVSIIKFNKENQTGRNNSLNLKNVRSLSKKKTDTQDSNNQSKLDESNSDSNNNTSNNYNIQKINNKLEELTIDIKQSQNSRKSMSPIKIDYGNFRESNMIKNNHTEISTPVANIKLFDKSQIVNSTITNFSSSNKTTQSFLNFEYNPKNNVRFLNFVRKKKKESEILNN
jgi:hypothetical protein